MAQSSLEEWARENQETVSEHDEGVMNAIIDFSKREFAKMAVETQQGKKPVAVYEKDGRTEILKKYLQPSYAVNDEFGYRIYARAGKNVWNITIRGPKFLNDENKWVARSISVIYIKSGGLAVQKTDMLEEGPNQDKQPFGEPIFYYESREPLKN